MNRRGFTLVELLVVAVVGILLVMATYQVLVVNQRTYTVQNEQVRAQQASRAALDVLFSELREVSSRGGDILGFDDDTLAVRAMRAYGLVCNPSWTLIPTFRVRPVGSDSFAVGDSVFVFTDNSPGIASDDDWKQVVVSGVANNVTCPDGTGAQDLTFAGEATTFTNDVVLAGAPVRGYFTYVYGLFQTEGDSYLGRKVPGGSAVPLVGPLRPGTDAAPGLSFEYLDSDGAAALTATDIREIRVIVRTISDAKKPNGSLVQDSITASIYTRN